MADGDEIKDLFSLIEESSLEWSVSGLYAHSQRVCACIRVRFNVCAICSLFTCCNTCQNMYLYLNYACNALPQLGLYAHFGFLP